MENREGEPYFYEYKEITINGVPLKLCREYGKFNEIERWRVSCEQLRGIEGFGSESFEAQGNFIRRIEEEVDAGRLSSVTFERR